MAATEVAELWNCQEDGIGRQRGEKILHPTARLAHAEWQRERDVVEKEAERQRADGEETRQKVRKVSHPQMSHTDRRHTVLSVQRNFCSDIKFVYSPCIAHNPEDNSNSGWSYSWEGQAGIGLRMASLLKWNTKMNFIELKAQYSYFYLREMARDMILAFCLVLTSPLSCLSGLVFCLLVLTSKPAMGWCCMIASRLQEFWQTQTHTEQSLCSLC